ncbi:hypothetical protein [Faecalibacterium sp. I3-3-89]|uniref:hypothetical protein n=1 Tax=unclassified Faecalibacterium TaxID=2646395 RepID=UPI002014C883|nr:hypothetical protein [Faecalibacterium sp. I3-3-89]UQK42298.1 hypothetical protein MTP38_09305 [Faecalibacterium sp. I3-3-89]
MMMPANFTAVNSEVVYGGADLFSVLADTTAPIWNAANVKQFNTNVITLVSNSFQSIFTEKVLGTMFSGNWGGDDGVKLFGDEGTLKLALYGDDDMGFGNKVMRTLGLASVVYTLGTAPAKIDFNDGVASFDAKLK